MSGSATCRLISLTIENIQIIDFYKITQGRNDRQQDNFAGSFNRRYRVAHGNVWPI